MNKLIAFLRNRLHFLTFLVLEITAITIYYNQSPYHSAVFFNSSNHVTATLLEAKANTDNYFNLVEQNKKLAIENTQLKNKLHKVQYVLSESLSMSVDTSKNPYRYLSANVINSTTAFVHNYITINKGYDDGVQVGMGVISSKGVVGKVKSCSKNFSTITSVLHTDMLISSRVKKIKALGALKWDGKDISNAKLMYIPRHLKVHVGDTVVTSEENSVFPYGLLVGVVQHIQTLGDNNFIDIDVKLATDFKNLDYVYVINHRLRTELDSLQAKVQTEKTNAK